MAANRGVSFPYPVYVKDARTLLEGVRRSSPAGALVTFTHQVERVYGQGRQRGDNAERWLIEYALDIANGDTERLEIEDWLKYAEELEKGAKKEYELLAKRTYDQLVKKRGVKVAAKVSAAQLDSMNKDHDRQIANRDELKKRYDDELMSRRAGWRQFLADVIANRARVAERFHKDAAKMLENVWTLPTVERTAAGLAVRHHYLIPNLDAFDSFVRLLLLDEKFDGELCQCHLNGCERFFLMKRPATGRPQRRYCSRGHMLEAHAQESTLRSQKSRAKKKAKARRQI